jgi:hypothetical protein
MAPSALRVENIISEYLGAPSIRVKKLHHFGTVARRNS